MESARGKGIQFLSAHTARDRAKAYEGRALNVRIELQRRQINSAINRAVKQGECKVVFNDLRFEALEKVILKELKEAGYALTAGDAAINQLAWHDLIITW
jgi:hypothetical protein